MRSYLASGKLVSLFACSGVRACPASVHPPSTFHSTSSPLPVISWTPPHVSYPIADCVLRT